MGPPVLALFVFFAGALSPGTDAPEPARAPSPGSAVEDADDDDRTKSVSSGKSSSEAAHGASLPAAVEDRTFEERALLGAVTGISAAGATLAAAAVVFSATIAFATLVPLFVQLVFLPLFPLTLLVPPVAAVVAAVLAGYSTTDWLGLSIVGGVTGLAALATFFVATVVFGPILFGAFPDERLGPGGGVFEMAILGNVLLPPLVVGLVAGVTSAIVVGGVLRGPIQE
jgi:hypothetical protein